MKFSIIAAIMPQASGGGTATRGGARSFGNRVASRRTQRRFPG